MSEPISSDMQIIATVNPAQTPALSWLRWFVAMLVAVPLSVLLHELGHFLAAVACGFADPQFHYMSAGGTSDYHPLWQEEVEIMAGPLMTMLVILICCGLAKWWKPLPFLIALGLAASFRNFFSVIYLLSFSFGFKRMMPSDEAALVAYTDWALAILAGFNVFVLAASWIILLRRLPKAGWKRALSGLFGGAVVGWSLYLTIGPLLLP